MESEPMPVNDMSSIASNPTRIKTIALFSFYDQSALATLRMLGPAKMAGWEILHGYDFYTHEVNLEVVDKAELVIFQRDFSRDYDTYTQVTSLLRAQNKPFILDLDDNLFELPADHPDRISGYYVDALLPTFQSVMDADLITVATEPLRQYLLPYNPNIQVIPNYLDDSIWSMATHATRADDSDRITIGYMGGDTHRPDVRMVVPALLRLLEKYPDRIQFHFWGIEPPAELARYSQVDWYPALFTHYDEFTRAFQAIEADILIAPLCDSLFNSCKSAIKFFEYGAAGIAGVYSYISPYKYIIEHGKDGFLASTEDDWVDGLSQLIETPILRKQLVENAQQKIGAEWLLSRNISKRIHIYEDLIADFQPKERVSTPFYKLEQTLSAQYYEEAVRKNAQIRSMKAQIEEKDKQVSQLDQQVVHQEANIKQLEEEVLSYAMSRSWRVTRPFRGIMRFLKRLVHA